MAELVYYTDTAGTNHEFRDRAGNWRYGTCDTAAATAAKVATLANFILVSGATVHIKFTNSNTASNPTLNVNGTGAKPIMRYGTTVPGTSAKTSWQAGSVVTLTYDGTNWQMNGWLNDDTDNDYKACSYNSTGTKLFLVGAASQASSSTTGIATKSNSNVYITTGNKLHDVGGDVANTVTYTATIGTTWTGSAAPYSQTITVSGIKASDNPIVDLVPSSTYETATAEVEAWGKVYKITTAANSITVYATDKTTTSIPIQLKCVR